MRPGYRPPGFDQDLSDLDLDQLRAAAQATAGKRLYLKRSTEQAGHVCCALWYSVYGNRFVRSHLTLRAVQERTQAGVRNEQKLLATKISTPRERLPHAFGFHVFDVASAQRMCTFSLLLRVSDGSRLGGP